MPPKKAAAKSKGKEEAEGGEEKLKTCNTVRGKTESRSD